MVEGEPESRRLFTSQAERRRGEHALTVAIAQYQIGSRDFTTVLTAEQNLYQAHSNLATAEGNVADGLTRGTSD